MKLPVQWLREYVETPLGDQELADRLTMAGLEVEETTQSEVGPVYHTKVTPNRGDWMSISGVAREAAASLDLTYQPKSAPLPDENNDVNRWAGVLVTDPALCPRYGAKVIRNVTIQPSPEWMQQRLLAAGMRPINVVVDITNYVMLELGQPLHAFDYDKLPEGKVIVRPAHAGEKITTLDGVDRDLEPGMLMICDRAHPVCVAGVMGNAETEVSAETRHLFLEAAHFDAGSIRRTAKRLNLTTEASYRFERFVDPSLVPVALERASELLADLAGGEVVLGRIDLYPNPLEAKRIALRPARVNAILGTRLSEEAIAHSLRRLGLIVENSGDAFGVIVPTFRPDLVKEIDLIEEVARMIGYETLPETVPPARGGGGGDASYSRFASLLRTHLVGMGLQEALTNSLVAPSPFDPADAKRVMIRSALSAELSSLRLSLTPNLLEALARNVRQRLGDVRLFEIGKVFALGDQAGSYEEQRFVAGVLTGLAAPRGWESTQAAPADFFTAKGVVEALLAILRLPVADWTPAERPLMHPGRCAEISVSGQMIGYVAEVEPEAVREHLDAPASIGRVCVFELNATVLETLVTESRSFQSLPRFPALSRDLAVVVDRALPYGRIETAVRAVADSDLLEDLSLQSVYVGDRIPEGKKSVALRLTFRSGERTLTDSDVDAQMTAIQEALAVAVGAEQR